MMKFDNQTFKFTNIGNIGNYALIVGIVGIAASAFGYTLDAKQLFYSYLTSYLFWISIGLGGLFFTMLHHLVGATWSVVLRRLFENVMNILPMMILLFIPIALGMGHLYRWSDSEGMAADQLLKAKSGYLNTGFFLARALLYFAVWFLLSRSLYKSSLKQDESHDETLRTRFKRISAPGMILFAATITFAAFDWIMSLDAHWYSTIFGAYFFAGCAMSAMAFTTLAAYYLRRNQVLAIEITVEHYHDLGKLTFAFTVFWAYMAFSQYFLIWYANIPEETVWYLHRWEGSWKLVSLLIVFGHFAIPFLALITQGAKRNPTALAVICIWLLLMHWIDLYWLVLPNLHKQGVSFSWMDITTMVGIGGVVIWYFWRRLTSQPLLPINDPKLDASKRFVNQ